jgi:hypothetical protein
LLSLASLAAVVVYAIASGGSYQAAADITGGVAVALLALAIALRWPSVVPWTILAAGVAYLAGRGDRDVVDGWASVVGVLLLLAAELAFWSIDHNARVKSERSLTVRRIITLASLVGAALLVNFLLLATAAVSASSGVILAAAGVAAAVAAVSMVLRLARG